MNLHQLEYIVALDTHRHFLKAAEACNITQATLSAMIKKLEDELGVVLFDRSKQPVEPTETGIDIVLQAHVILRESRRLQDIIHDSKAQVKGELRVGIIPTLAPYLLPLFLTQFIKAYPDVTLSVAEITTAEIRRSLKENTLHAGILATPLEDPALQEQILFYEEFYYYGNLKKDQAQEKRLQPSDIDTDGLLLLEDGHCLRNQIINLCDIKKQKQGGFQLDYQSGSVEALIRMVELNLGATILPELATGRLAETDQLKLRRFVEPVPVREISLVVHKHYIKKSLVAALRGCILQHLPASLLEKKGVSVLSI